MSMDLSDFLAVTGVIMIFGSLMGFSFLLNKKIKNETLLSLLCGVCGISGLVLFIIS